ALLQDTELTSKHCLANSMKCVQLSRLVGSNSIKMLRNLLALPQIAQRTKSTAACRQFENQLPEKQKLFQKDDGIPVHLKATTILTVGGTAHAIHQLAMALHPKEQDLLQFTLPAISWFYFIQFSMDQ
uniref:Cytochrome c oxidase subunit 7A2, mitochondrial n=1 Tax=Rhinolophus ferrumequinum TaxID=59479 RepID=A0A671FCC9_RHIFE